MVFPLGWAVAGFRVARPTGILHDDGSSDRHRRVDDRQAPARGPADNGGRRGMAAGEASAMGEGTGPRWEHFAHGADIGVRGIGATLAQSFEQAALALVAVVVDPAKVRDSTAVAIRAEAPDVELLLVDWLNAVVYAMATRDVLFARFEVALDGLRLQGIAHGEPVDRGRHEPAVEVKGATYTALAVRQGDDGAWIAQCVVDV